MNKDTEAHCHWDLLSNKLTARNSHSWESNSYLADHYVLSVLLDPKGHYRVHKAPPLVLMHMNFILILSSYLHLVLPSKLVGSGFPASAIKIMLRNIILHELSEEACAEFIFVSRCSSSVSLVMDLSSSEFESQVLGLPAMMWPQ